MSSGVTEQLGALVKFSTGAFDPPPSLRQPDCGWLLARMGWHWGGAGVRNQCTIPVD